MKIVYVVLLMGIFAAKMVVADDLMKLSLDDVTKVSPAIVADTTVKVEGNSSVKITSSWPTTVCLGELEAPDCEGATLVYSAKLKTELEKGGSAFLEIWAHVDGGKYFSKGLNDTADGKSDWKSIQAMFAFQKGQKPDKVTLNVVINGKGTLWIDDVRLSKEA